MDEYQEKRREEQKNGERLVRRKEGVRDRD